MTPPVATSTRTRVWVRDGIAHQRGAGMSTGCYEPVHGAGWVHLLAEEIGRHGARPCYKVGCFPNGMPGSLRAAA